MGMVHARAIPLLCASTSPPVLCARAPLCCMPVAQACASGHSEGQPGGP